MGHEVLSSLPGIRLHVKTLGQLFVNAGQILLVAILSTILIIVALVSRLFGPDAPLQVAGRLWGPGVLWICGARFVVVGGEDIDWKKPHLFLMNHQSMLDIPAAFAAIRSPIRFVAKRILGSVPVLGWYMKATRMILVNREKGSEAVAAIRIAAERLQQGASILIYPEGTRSRDGRLLPFKRGPFELAIASQVDIVPLAIHGAAHVLPRGSASPRRGVIRVAIGAPIATQGLVRADREALMASVRGEIEALHRSIGGEGYEPLDAEAPSKEHGGTVTARAS
ncbi:MAG TPA: lysophospholipid acyltransferase family protein [Vulgatibacter sp.]|nr:lysophospholipid acyltransferase family protein [Vulgatibacter sp.]